MLSRYFIVACAVACQVFATSTAFGQFDDPPEVWLVKPKPDAKPTQRDLAARKTLLETLEKSADPKFWDNVIIDVPKDASGLPESYTIQVHGKYINWEDVASALTIQVRDGKATATLLQDTGIKAGELPFEEVDLLARQLVYAFRAEFSYKQGRPLLGRGSHPTYTTAEIISHDKRLPLHLRTEAWDTVRGWNGEFDALSEGVRGFMHSQICPQLNALARENLKPLPREEQLQRVAAGLERLKPAESEEDWTDRNDLEAVEALLFSHLATTHIQTSALLDLKRLHLDYAARRIEITISPDPWPELAAALSSDDDHRLEGWALEQLKNEPRYRSRLVALLPELSSDDIWSVLDLIRDYELTPPQLEMVRQIYCAERERMVKVKLAIFLLERTRDETFFEYLLPIAQLKRKTGEWDLDDEQQAASAVLSYARRTKKRQEEAAALLKTLLETATDDERCSLLRYHVPHTHDELPLFEKFAADRSVELSACAIEIIGEIDERLALKRAAERIKRVLKEEEKLHGQDYYLNPLYDLLFWKNDRSVLDELVQMKAKLQTEMYGEHPEIALLIDYLSAVTVETRLKSTHAYINFPRCNLSEQRVADVARDLMTAGADRAKCEALVEGYRKKFIKW